MDPVYRTVIVLSLSVLLASSASHKLRSSPVFHHQMAAYGLVPRPLIGIVGFLLAFYELTLAAALLVPFMAPLALNGAAILLIFYALMMEVAWQRGKRSIDCGCGGPEGPIRISHGLILRNVVMAVLAVFAAQPGLDRSLSVWDQGLVVFVGTTFWTFYYAANQLLANNNNLRVLRQRL